MRQPNTFMTSTGILSKSIKNKAARVTLCAWVLLALCLVMGACSSSRDDDNDVTPTKDKETYTVTFDLNGGTGTAPKAQTVTEGNKATKPADPTRGGHTFDGWYDAKTGGNKFAFGTATVTKAMTLYAHWVTNTYTVTFELNYDRVADATTDTVEHGKTITKPADPTRTGYTFDGWYTETETTTLFAFDTSTINADITLYAKWLGDTYTVTFNLNYDGAADATTDTAEHGKTITKPADPTRTGYTFDGWYEKQDGTGTAFAFSTTTVTKAITLYAGWTIKTYTVTFNFNRTSPKPETKTVEHGKTTTALADPEITGNDFDGWYKQKDGSGEKFDFTTTPITGDITLYAKWIPKTYIITFELNYSGATATTETVKQSNRTKIPEPNPAPTRTGYNFGGWYEKQDFSGGKFDFIQTLIRANTTLYAKWTVTVTFDLNYPGTTGTVPDPQTVTEGKTATEPQKPSTDLTFDGWYTDAKTDGNKFDFDTTLITKNITLYAKWIKTYTVQFRANGGYLAGSGREIVEDGKMVSEPNLARLRSGHVFDGWYDAETDGNKFDFTTRTITANIILYAHWTAYSITVTIDGVDYTLAVDGGTLSTVVNTPTYAEFHAITEATLKEVHLNAPTSPAKGEIINNIKDGKGSIVIDGKAVTIKLMMKPKDNGDLKTIVSDAIKVNDKTDLNFIDTSSITDMSNLFRSKARFNGNISDWDTSKVTNMSGMFADASDFNKEIRYWDTSKVTNMSFMFSGASAFDKSIGGWKTGEVTDMTQMFFGARSFDQYLGWDVTNVTSYFGMFERSGMANKTGKQPDFN